MVSHHCLQVDEHRPFQTHSILSHENDSARQLSTSAAVGGGENPSPERPIEVNAEQLPGGSRDSAPLGGPPPNGDNSMVPCPLFIASVVRKRKTVSLSEGVYLMFL